MELKTEVRGQRSEVRGKVCLLPIAAKQRFRLCGTAYCLLALLLAGCGGTTIVEKTETIIKYDTLRIPVPVIEDTLEAVPSGEGLEGWVHAEKIVGKDTVIDVRYYPLEKKFYIKVKPDTIYIPRADTIAIIHKAEIIKEPGFLEKNFWYIVVILAVIAVVIVLVIIGFEKLKNIFWFK